MPRLKRITGELADHALKRRREGASFRKIANELSDMCDGDAEISKSTVADFFADEEELPPEEFAYEVRRNLAEDAPETYQKLERIDQELAAIAACVSRGLEDPGIKAWPLLVKRQKYLIWKLQLAGVMTAAKPTPPAVVATVTVEAQVLPPVVDPPRLEAAAAQPVVEVAVPELVAEPAPTEKT